MFVVFSRLIMVSILNSHLINLYCHFTHTLVRILAVLSRYFHTDFGGWSCVVIVELSLVKVGWSVLQTQQHESFTASLRTKGGGLKSRVWRWGVWRCLRRCGGARIIWRTSGEDLHRMERRRSDGDPFPVTVRHLYRLSQHHMLRFTADSLGLRSAMSFSMDTSWVFAFSIKTPQKS